MLKNKVTGHDRSGHDQLGSLSSQTIFFSPSHAFTVLQLDLTTHISAFYEIILFAQLSVSLNAERGRKRELCLLYERYL